MKPQYDAIQLTPAFIDKGTSPLKLQKLLYYSQLWFYVKTGGRLFSDDIKAWIYGPVVRDVWNRYKIMRRSDIIPKTDYFTSDRVALHPDVEKHLNDVWDAYGHLSGADLVDLTHSELPWLHSRNGLLSNQPSDNQILINDYTTSDFSLDEHGNIPKAAHPHSLGYFTS